VSSRDATELDKAVAVEREAGPEQPALFEGEEGLPAVAEPPRFGKGRQPGARNLRSEAYAALLVSRYGDPLVIATKIAAKNMLDREIVEELAKTWGCSRYEAVKLWAAINRDVQPYLHQTLPRAVVLNPGAPGGDRVLLEAEGELIDITPTDDPTEHDDSEAA
jgi:hypothetical protein